MGWSALADVFSNITGWFTTDRVDKRHRKKIKKLMREIDDLFQKSNTAGNRKRLDSKLAELRSLRDDLAS